MAGYGSSAAGDRVVGSRTLDTDAFATTVGDPHRRIWEQHDESLEAFEERVEAEAEALHQTSG
jgi:hypothetical protein